MNVITGVILGLLIGWLVEWVIDWIYWRRKVGASEAAQKELAAAYAKIEELQEKCKDPLEIISGVGRVIAGKLNDAGIFTFEDMAALTQPDLELIVGKSIKNLADEEDLIKQAKRFAKEKARARKGR